MITLKLRSFSSLIKLVSLILIRSKIILTLVLSISMPTAMATAVSLSTLLLHEQIKAVSELIHPRPSNILTDALYENENCIAINIAYAYAVYGNHSFYVQIHIVREFNRYIDAQGIKFIGKHSLQNGVLSVGESLASKYRVDLGRPITICIYNQCYNLTVQSIHRGPDFFNYIIITNTSMIYNNNNTSIKYLCLSTVNPALAGILHSVGRDTERFLDFLSIVIPLSYMLIVFIAINRVVNNYKGDIALIAGLGVSRKKLAACFTSVFIFMACLFALYGIALGVVFFHLSIWVLKFIGMPIFVKPIPSINLIVFLSFTYIPMVILSLVLAFIKLGEEA